ncbi:MAG: NAD-binding protein [Planctomycetes bacterium]|nr:NAD-binding protein [Planctomycetota bacterium]
MRSGNIFRKIQKTFLRFPVGFILVVLVLAYLSATVVVMVALKQDFISAAMMCLPAFLGELGSSGTSSTVVNVAILFSLLISVAFLAILTAKITSIFVEICQQGGSIVNTVDFTDHIIVCGWNVQGPSIVAELLSSGTATRNGIAILANCDRRPIKDGQVEFIRGDPSQDDDLRRAGVETAHSVIVLSDLTKSANEADAEALMIVLAVENINRSVQTCVQVLNAANRVHLERAHADEIICLDQMGGNLVVASATNHGISHVVRELLTFNSGSEFYRLDDLVSPNLVGKEFSEAVAFLAQRRMLLVGFETDASKEEAKQLFGHDVVHSPGDGDRAVVVNPQGQYIIREGDALFVIAESKPENL